MIEKESRIALSNAKRQGIIEAADGKCEVCRGNKAREIHHVDEDRSRNTSDNLIALCEICHNGYHQFRLSRDEIEDAVKRRDDKHRHQIARILQNVRPKNVDTTKKKVKAGVVKGSDGDIGRKEGSVEDNILNILNSNSNGIKKSDLVNEVVEKFGRNRGAVSRVLADESDYVSGGTMIQRGIVVKKGDLLVVASNKRRVNTVKKSESSTNKNKSKGFLDKVKNALKEFDDDLS